MRPICRFSVAGSSRFFERAMRAARRASADPLAELVTHGSFFVIGRTAQDHGLAALGMARELDLDAFVDHASAVG
jgi:hypothetical protein